MERHGSSSKTARRPLVDRLMLVAAKAHARRVLDRFLQSTLRVEAIQDRQLFEKIRRNAESDYGVDHGFRSIRTYADFARSVPITSYDALEPYVERVRAGETKAMFGGGQLVRMFAKTSGTTDRPKYIPVTEAFLTEYRRGWNAFGLKVIMDHPGCILRPIVQVTSPMDEERSAGGYPCGAITGLMAATQKRLVRRYYVVPREVANIPDADARYYCAVRFSVTSDVAFLVTASPATQLRLARSADQRREDLIRDVRDGTLCENLDIPNAIRARLAERLHPNRLDANRLESIVSRTGRLLPKDFWNISFLANWMGGTMGLYLRDFPEYFGSVPVRDIGLIASEGRMSIPIEDGTPAGILNVTDNFYEFIPAESYGQSDPPVLRASELVVGQEYFILLTTSAGFYRYDIGDRVRVTGRYNEAPVIEFLHKGVHTSSLAGEKLTDQQVVMAFDALADAFGLAGRSFVVAPQWGGVPFYRLHVDRDQVGSRIASRLAPAFDERLREINVEYASKRSSGRLGGVELNLLPAGWLAEHQQRIASRQRAANEQFKHRYLLSEIGADKAYPIGNGSEKSEVEEKRPVGSP